MQSAKLISSALIFRSSRDVSLRISLGAMPSALCNPGCITQVPVRGMRGVKSVILHKEVIEKHQFDKGIGSTEGSYAELQSLKPAQCTDNEDMPIDGLTNPYVKPHPKCILCDLDVELDYKNTRLLSQFVSSHTGQIYGRSVTGLCLFMQKRVAKLIKRSQYFGFMPYELKDPRFIKDPKLFDPFKRK